MKSLISIAVNHVGILMAKSNAFIMEYFTGRKDQYDVDSKIFKKGIEETSSRDDLIQYVQEKFHCVISRIADQRAQDLMEELELL